MRQPIAGLFREVAELLKESNVPVLALSALALGFMRGPLDWMLPLLILEKGDPMLIGVIFALANADDTVMAFLGGPLADRYGRRPIIMLSTSFYVVGCLVLLVAVVSEGLVAIVLISLAAVLLYGVTGVSAGPYSALLAESVGSRSTGKAFAWLALCGRLARASGSLVLGFLLTANRDLGLLVMLGCASVGLLLHSQLKETLLLPRGWDSGASFTAHAKEFFAGVRCMLPLGLLALLGVIVLTGLGQGLTGNYYPPYLGEQLGLDEAQIGLLYSIMMVLQAVALPFAGSFVDRYGHVAGLVLGNVIPGGLILYFALAQSRVLALAAMLAAAVLGAWGGVALPVAVAKLTSLGTRATIFGVSESVFNLTFVVGPLAGGGLYARNPTFPFILGSVALLSTILLARRLSAGVRPPRR